MIMLNGICFGFDSIRHNAMNNDNHHSMLKISRKALKHEIKARYKVHHVLFLNADNFLIPSSFIISFSSITSQSINAFANAMLTNPKLLTIHQTNQYNVMSGT